jgi:hypothetical protein
MSEKNKITAKNFRKYLREHMQFANFEKIILDASCRSLVLYLDACDALDKKGQVTTSASGFVRKSPHVENAKTHWSSFLAGLRALKITETYADVVKHQENPLPPKRGRKLEGV